MKRLQISDAMLMTAGLGTRLRPFTNHQTKALLPVMGIPISQFALTSLASVGVTKVVANVHHLAKQTIVGLHALKSDAQLVISDESTELLGSAGGIKKAIQNFGTRPFFLANGDVLCDVDWNSLASCHKKLRAKWGVHLTLTLFPKGPMGGTYREILFDAQSGLITGLGTLQSEKPFFVGAAVIEPEAFDHIENEGPSEFVPMVLEPAIRSRKAGVFLASGCWFDIGSPSLWRSTHISLIERLELGYFPSRASQRWRREVELVNTRVAERTWISNQFSKSFSRTKWSGPCYWGRGSSELAGENILVPQEFGPGSILYGSIENRANFGLGIGFGGEWLSL